MLSVQGKFRVIRCISDFWRPCIYLWLKYSGLFVLLSLYFTGITNQILNTPGPLVKYNLQSINVVMSKTVMSCRKPRFVSNSTCRKGSFDSQLQSHRRKPQPLLCIYSTDKHGMAGQSASILTMSAWVSDQCFKSQLTILQSYHDWSNSMAWSLNKVVFVWCVCTGPVLCESDPQPVFIITMNIVMLYARPPLCTFVSWTYLPAYPTSVLD